MATYNQMQVQQKPKFSVAITTKGYQSLISNTLRDPARARRFTASITSAVAVNPALQECDAGTILAGALLGESLNLSPSPQLGQYYLVPFKQKAKYDRNNRLIRQESVTAQFVLGYKGYIQLALRSGQYKDLDVMVIKQGEYLGKDPETGKAKFQFVEDDGFGDVQQQRVGERLREDHVGFVHEHHGFAEGLALADDVDDLFGALGGGESQFDLAVDDQMESG